MSIYNSQELGETHLMDAGNNDESLYIVWYEHLDDDDDKHAVLVEEGFDKVDGAWDAFEGYSNGRYIDHLPYPLHVIRTGPGEDIIGLSMSYDDAVTQAIEWKHETWGEEEEEG